MMRTGRYAYRTDTLMGHKNAPGRAAAARGLAPRAVTGKALCSLRGWTSGLLPALAPLPTGLFSLGSVLVSRGTSLARPDTEDLYDRPGPASNHGNAVGAASGSAAGKLSSIAPMVTAVSAAPARVQPNSRNVSRKPTACTRRR